MGSDQPTGRARSKPVPSKLKRLAEERARAAGELEVHLIAHKAVERSYLKLQAKFQIAQNRFAESEKQRALLEVQVASLDEQIKAVAPGVNPICIDPIRANKGKYSAHGSLRAFLLKTLQDRTPAYVPTPELSQLAIEAFGLTFTHSELRRLWGGRSMVGALHWLEREGQIERNPSMHKSANGPTNSWRHKIETSLLLSDL